ncbi:hypothetical protein ACHAWF_005544 [Thalassiosira exigua]
MATTSAPPPPPPIARRRRLLPARLAVVAAASFAVASPSSVPVCGAFQLRPTQHRRAIRRSIRGASLRAATSPEDVSDRTFSLAVIGAGPVGVSAALLAARKTENVILIDAPRASGALMNEATGEDLSLGGPTGLFSKALRDAGKRISVSSLKGMGLRDDSVWNEVVTSCVELASFNARDTVRQLDYAGVTYVQGSAAFADSGGSSSLFVTSDDNSISTLSADKILIATGSTPFRPGGIPFDGRRIFDSDSINTLLVADLARSGIKIERGAQVKKFHIPKGNDRAPVVLDLEAKGGGDRPTGATTQIKCDIYLAAVGRKPNTAQLNLQAAGIRTDSYGGIEVDPALRATARDGNVYAAGDVLGRPFLASTGMAQGFAAVESMFGKESTVTAGEDEDEVDEEEESSDGPACKVGELCMTGEKFDPKSLASNPYAFPVGVWTSPEAAYYGLSMQQCREMGIDAGEGVALYAECLRGLVFSPNGLLKLVFNKENGQIMGVHICGDDACELIHYGMELVKAERTIDDVLSNLYSAVTFHEMYRIAAMAAVDEVGARKRRAAAGRALTARYRGSAQE